MKTLITSKKSEERKGHPERGDFFKLRPSQLRLANGETFAGLSPAWQSGAYMGEVVFNTGMTGYVESLTDPSYAGQILTFTYPLIGNYGVSAAESWESAKIHAKGVVVSEACANFSHTLGEKSLLAWLKQQNVPIITDVDTRALTKVLRGGGTMPGVITGAGSSIKPKLDTTALVPQVSLPDPIVYNPGQKYSVILVDCGAKQNIVRQLLELPVTVKRVPHDYDYVSENFDAVFLSNGPGDPTDCLNTVAILKKALKQDKPVFGICLGTQIMALAAGAKTYKLPFGHRGHNQPCQDTATSRCYITSQNHGYAIDEKTLPMSWRVSFRNLNDNSVEGIAHRTKPFAAVQFHPEASPGPTDSRWLFDEFYRTFAV